jgi:transcriptional regulator with XRE-family HTH domain
MSQEDIYINGDLLRLRREAGGWAINDMAIRACLSVKQVRQLEDGGMSSFYSQSVKATAAKKVGAILGLSPEQVFAETVEPSQEPEAIETEIVHHAEDTDPVVIEAALAPATLPEAVEAQVEAPVHVVKKPASAPAPAPSAEEPKSKSSLWLIAGLFAAALAVAAYMQPREEPAAEPAPPLQVVPSEDAASAASAADVSASAPVEGASMAAVEASSPRPAASVAAPISARSVSISTAASAPAAAASKAP